MEILRQSVPTEKGWEPHKFQLRYTVPIGLPSGHELRVVMWSSGRDYVSYQMFHNDVSMSKQSIHNGGLNAVLSFRVFEEDLDFMLDLISSKSSLDLKNLPDVWGDFREAWIEASKECDARYGNGMGKEDGDAVFILQ